LHRANVAPCLQRKQRCINPHVQNAGLVVAKLLSTSIFERPIDVLGVPSEPGSANAHDDRTRDLFYDEIRNAGELKVSPFKYEVPGIALVEIHRPFPEFAGRQRHRSWWLRWRRIETLNIDLGGCRLVLLLTRMDHLLDCFGNGWQATGLLNQNLDQKAGVHCLR